ncbi:repetitive organellar protein isoform X2 [Tribolium castaneum]|uniref:repetitive organellar protein isoform X2 n=1 Tax=Tribolium castaneum TaxID=7070 RepID=UPI0030FE644D
MQMATSIETDTGEMIVKRVSVPVGLEELMEGLTKEVLSKKPKDIYLFASEYFAHLLNLREKGSLKVGKRAQSVTKQIPANNLGKNLKIKSNSVDAVKNLSRQISLRSSSPANKTLTTKKITLEDKNAEKTKSFLNKRKARKTSKDNSSTSSSSSKQQSVDEKSEKKTPRSRERSVNKNEEKSTKTPHKRSQEGVKQEKSASKSKVEEKKKEVTKHVPKAVSVESSTEDKSENMKKDVEIIDNKNPEDNCIGCSMTTDRATDLLVKKTDKEAEVATAISHVNEETEATSNNQTDSNNNKEIEETVSSLDEVDSSVFSQITGIKKNEVEKKESINKAESQEIEKSELNKQDMIDSSNEESLNKKKKEAEEKPSDTISSDLVSSVSELQESNETKSLQNKKQKEEIQTQEMNKTTTKALSSTEEDVTSNLKTENETQMKHLPDKTTNETTNQEKNNSCETETGVKKDETNVLDNKENTNDKHKASSEKDIKNTKNEADSTSSSKVIYETDKTENLKENVEHEKAKDIKSSSKDVDEINDKENEKISVESNKENASENQENKKEIDVNNTTQDKKEKVPEEMSKLTKIPTPLMPANNGNVQEISKENKINKQEQKDVRSKDSIKIKNNKSKSLSQESLKTKDEKAARNVKRVKSVDLINKNQLEATKSKTFVKTNKTQNNETTKESTVAPENKNVRKKRSTSVEVPKETNLSKTIKQTSFDSSKLREELKQVDEIGKVTAFKTSYNPYILRQEIKQASQKSEEKNPFETIAKDVTAAIKIQTAWRGFTARKKTNKLQNDRKSTVDENQKKTEVTQGTDNKSAFEDIAKDVAAAIKIQSMWRGFLARKKNNKLTQSSKNDKKNKNESKTVKGLEEIEKQKVTHASEKIEAEETNTPEKRSGFESIAKDVTAAIKIQSVWRGFLSRKRKKHEEYKAVQAVDINREPEKKDVEQTSKENKIQDKNNKLENIVKDVAAAIKIQSIWRGFLVRKKTKKSDNDIERNENTPKVMVDKEIINKEQKVDPSIETSNDKQSNEAKSISGNVDENENRNKSKRKEEHQETKEVEKRDSKIKDDEKSDKVTTSALVIAEKNDKLVDSKEKLNNSEGSSTGNANTNIKTTKNFVKSDVESSKNKESVAKTSDENNLNQVQIKDVNENVTQEKDNTKEKLDEKIELTDVETSSTTDIKKDEHDKTTIEENKTPQNKFTDDKNSTAEEGTKVKTTEDVTDVETLKLNDQMKPEKENGHEKPENKKIVRKENKAEQNKLSNDKNFTDIQEETKVKTTDDVADSQIQKVNEQTKQENEKDQKKPKQENKETTKKEDTTGQNKLNDVKKSTVIQKETKLETIEKTIENVRNDEIKQGTEDQKQSKQENEKTAKTGQNKVSDVKKTPSLQEETKSEMKQKTNKNEIDDNNQEKINQIKKEKDNKDDKTSTPQEKEIIDATNTQQLSRIETEEKNEIKQNENGIKSDKEKSKTINSLSSNEKDMKEARNTTVNEAKKEKKKDKQEISKEKQYSVEKEKQNVEKIKPENGKNPKQIDADFKNEETDKKNSADQSDQNKTEQGVEKSTSKVSLQSTNKSDHNESTTKNNELSTNKLNGTDSESKSNKETNIDKIKEVTADKSHEIQTTRNEKEVKVGSSVDATNVESKKINDKQENHDKNSNSKQDNLKTKLENTTSNEKAKLLVEKSDSKNLPDNNQSEKIINKNSTTSESNSQNTNKNLQNPATKEHKEKIDETQGPDKETKIEPKLQEELLVKKNGMKLDKENSKKIVNEEKTNAMSMADAVLKIQALWRGFRARKQFERVFGTSVKKEVKNKEALEARKMDKTKAISKIQALWRGYQVRKGIREFDKKLSEQQQPAECDELPWHRGLSDDAIFKAACKIQAGVRGYMVRKKGSYNKGTLKSITEEPTDEKLSDEQVLEALNQLQEVPEEPPFIKAHKNPEKSVLPANEPNKSNQSPPILNKNELGSNLEKAKVSINATTGNEIPKNSTTESKEDNKTTENDVEFIAGELNSSTANKLSDSNSAPLIDDSISNSVVNKAEVDPISREEPGYEDAPTRPVTSNKKEKGEDDKEKNKNDVKTEPESQESSHSGDSIAKKEFADETNQNLSEEAGEKLRPGEDELAKTVDINAEIAKMSKTVLEEEIENYNKHLQEMAAKNYEEFIDTSTLKKEPPVEKDNKITSEFKNNELNNKLNKSSLENEIEKSTKVLQKNVLEKKDMSTETEIHEENAAASNVKTEKEILRVHIPLRELSDIKEEDTDDKSPIDASKNLDTKTRKSPTTTISLVHTGELHDAIAVPIPVTPPGGQASPPGLVNTGELHDNVVPLSVQLNEAPPAGAEVLTSPVSNSITTEAQASNKDASTCEAQPDKTTPSSDSMETEKRNNASIQKKSMEAEAATKIQAGFRGYQVRKQLKNKVSAPGDISNQRRSARRKSSGRLADSGRIAQTKSKSPSDIEEKSAVKIQAGVRGFLVRRRQKKQIQGKESS